MSKFILVVFPSEAKASEGLSALHQLHEEASISLYSTSVIKREKTGSLSVKQTQDEGPVGMGVGALVGALVGLFAGPMGAAIGYGTGALLGSVRDLYDLGVDEDFIDEISQKLAPGKTGVVAEISEEWVTPLDTRMHAFGGTVLRQWRDEFVYERNQRRIEALKADLSRRKEELGKKAEKVEAHLNEQVAEIQGTLKRNAEKAQKQLEQYKTEADAKIAALQEQAAKAKSDAKAKIEKRVAEMRADHEKRSAKLKQAFDLIKEAFKAA